MVAKVGKDDGGVQTATRRKKGVQKRTFRLCGTMEKQAVEILSGKDTGGRNSRVKGRKAGETLEVRKKLLMGKARASGTNKRYKKWWREFELFCEGQEKAPLPAESTTVEDFLTWLEMCGRGASAEVAAAAIRATHLDRGTEDPCNTHGIRTLRKGIKRIVAEEAEEKVNREPFPVEALRKWTGSRPIGVSTWRWRRDAALVAVGLRCMRRPGELAAMRIMDARWKEDGLWIFVRKSKTDQYGKGKLIPVDEGVDRRTCPVRLLKEWMEWNDRDPQAPLFPSVTSKFFASTGGISSIIKRMTEEAGIVGKFSGHSLRIGGATAAMKGGMSLAMIRAIGGWESQAVLVYLRAIGAAKAGASRQMGL